MKIHKVHVELKTIKMTLVVFMCIAFYTVLNSQDNTSLMMISASTAAFGIHSKTVDSWIFARYRVYGTALGCIGGTIYLLVQKQLQDNTAARLIFIPLLLFIIVTISGGVKSPITVRGAVMTLITMTLIAPTDDKNYVLARILATFVGSIMSVVINLLFAPREAHILKDLKESIEIEKKENQEEKESK